MKLRPAVVAESLSLQENETATQFLSSKMQRITVDVDGVAHQNGGIIRNIPGLQALAQTAGAYTVTTTAK
jgi:hypothetical protein